MSTTASKDQGLARRDIEEALAINQPFGSSVYILERVRHHYERRLEMLRPQAPLAADLLHALRDAGTDGTLVIGDPGLRCAIDAAVCRHKLNGPAFDGADLDAALRAGIASLAAKRRLPPLAEDAVQRIRLTETRVLPWLWCEQRGPDDALGAVFLQHFRRYHPRLELRTPDAGSMRMLNEGAALLETLLPLLAASVFDHVHLVCLVEAPSAAFTSLTNPHIPGVMFLSRATLQEPWQAAEFLLHEALHVKFVDLEHTHSLLAPDFFMTPSPLVQPPWNRPYPGNANEWPVNRALTVMHVYCGLALFFNAARHARDVLARRHGGPQLVDPVKQERRALDRARYLGEHLQRNASCLGFAGELFVAWLISMLDALDPEPAPAGTVEHLVRDLEEREAEEARKQKTTA